MLDNVIPCRGALVVFGLLASGCAGTVTLRCPAQGGVAWTAVDSPRLRLRTDAPLAEAQALFVRLATSLAVLEQVLPAGVAAPDREPIDVVVIQDGDGFEALAPPGASGWFVPRPDGGALFEDAPLVVLRGGESAPVQRRFQHELVHQLLPRRPSSAPLPPWLEEGLAEYYSTLRWSDRGGAMRVTVGELPTGTLFVNEPPANPGLGARLVESRVPLYEVPRLDELLAAPPSTFHHPARELAFYSASWVLVHLLASTPSWSDRLPGLIADIEDGVAPTEAWERRFADVTSGRLASDYRRHLEHEDQPGTERLLAGLDADAERGTSRLLGDDEVHLLWARVRPWTSREAIVAAGADIALAQAARPSAEAHSWMARYLHVWRRFDAAERELQRAVALGGDDARYRRALAALWRQRAEPARTIIPRGAGSARSAVLAN